MKLGILSFQPEPSYGQLTTIASALGHDAEEPIFSGGHQGEWKEYERLLKTADALILPSSMIFQSGTEDWEALLHRRIHEGLRIVYISLVGGPESLKIQNKFLAFYGLVSTDIRLHLATEAFVRVPRSTQAYRDSQLLSGVLSVAIASARLVVARGESLPVLLATDEDLPVDSGTDYAADWVGKDRPLIAAWHGDDGGAVLLTGGSLLAGPLKTNGGQYSELRENERLAKNILSFVLRGSKVREEQTPNQLLERAERNLADSVLNTLKKRPGGDWWYEGIPESVRRSAMDRHEVEKGRFPKEAYLYLLDLGAIIKFNFSIFEPMLEQVGWTGGKARSMGWLTKLNEHRRLAAHPLKAHLSDHEFTAEDVDFIKETERRISKLADSGGGT